MAGAIAYNVAATITEALGKEAIREIGLPGGVSDELEKLKNTLSTIQAVLLDAEEKQWAVNNPEMLEMLHAVYDVDDLLDGFSTDCLLLRDQMSSTPDKMPKKVRNLLSNLKHLFNKLKMGHMIKAITQKLDTITNDNIRFQAVGRLGEIGVRPRKRGNDHYFGRGAEVIGREDDMKKIIDILLSDSNVRENVGILPITGLGGLGKTTLAQLVFNNLEIDKYFQLKMWACVSENFDVIKVVEKILESARKRRPDSVERDTLVHGLKKEIDGKKYLLVLDDVWNEDVGKWNELKKLLMSGASGSRILITTRSPLVAEITKTIESYSLQGLDSQKSWCLFKQLVFENGEEWLNSRKLEVGKKIVEKCWGVPLVIIAIGRLLYLEDSEARWDSFEKNKLAKIKEYEILPTLKLSYDQLPSHLKQCFAYCSIFPKDYVMEKSKVISLWIAQGFIKLSNQNECLEDVGDEYFKSLLWRSFFQEAKMDDLRNIITFKMHDLMHDLAMSEVGSLITTVESDKQSISEKTRHISFVENIDLSFVIPTSPSKASRIRSLISLNQSEGLQGSSISWKAIFSSLKCLRAMHLHGQRLGSIPSSICKLKHLRDLDLSWNDKMKKLPNSISRLQNLYRLRLSYCTKLKQLPIGITELVNLRHLYNNGCTNLTYMPRGLGQLTNLQTLSSFDVHFDPNREDCAQLSEVNRLNCLRGELVIEGLRGGVDMASDSKGANLKEKEHLQVLTLNWRSRENVTNAGAEMALEGLEPHPNLKKLFITNYGGKRILTWLLSLTNLVNLSLQDCRKLKYLPSLNRLPSLKRISLDGLNEIEYVSDCSDNNEVSSSSTSQIPFFPSLEYLDFKSCPNLKGWWMSDSLMTRTGHALLFPCLSKLTIGECPMLTSLPMFPHLEEKLYLWKAGWKPVQQTLMIKNVNLPTTMEASSSFTPIAFSSAPLSKLKLISLTEIEDLETLPEDGLQNLISLRRLFIDNCRRLKSLSQGVQYLTALCELKLARCPMLDLGNDEDGTQWKGLKSLISLQFNGIPKLVSLPLGLQQVTTIQELEILNCSSLMAIPEWISNWASLHRFSVYTCSRLTSLPEAMRGLTSLKMFTIHDCPNLLRRCEENRGEDWPKISHIPRQEFFLDPRLKYISD